MATQQIIVARRIASQVGAQRDFDTYESFAQQGTTPYHIIAAILEMTGNLPNTNQVKPCQHAFGMVVKCYDTVGETIYKRHHAKFWQVIREFHEAR